MSVSAGNYGLSATRRILLFPVPRPPFLQWLIKRYSRRFSGDESFRATDPPSQDDAGMALGVVVEGRGHQHGHNSARHHHL